MWSARIAFTALYPASTNRHPRAPGLDDHVILMCNEGYQSSLAAATLQQLGFTRRTDLDGGFQAGHAAGLPTAPAKKSEQPAFAPAGASRTKATITCPLCGAQAARRCRRTPVSAFTAARAAARH
jgi:hypothetical protein